MREIKFRAWDLNKKEWRYAEIKDADDLFEDRYYGFMCDNLCQYTGLKDKNGREIYEGDIVRFRSYPEQVQTYELVGVVRYSEWGCYCVDEIIARKWEGFHHWVPPPTVNYFVNRPSLEWEVIGNIYDNPNLLEGE